MLRVSASSATQLSTVEPFVLTPLLSSYSLPKIMEMGLNVLKQLKWSLDIEIVRPIFTSLCLDINLGDKQTRTLEQWGL